MIKSGVIGNPIKHSKSPIIHGYWLNKYDINGSYKAIEIDNDDFEEQIYNLFKEGYAGFNVTIPYKIRIIDICDYLSDDARAIGAVNTVIRMKNGKIEGRNTDSFGFIENIKNNIDNYHFNNKNAMILGAGGAARACVYGLLKEGTKKLYISNRTKEKAENLAKEMKKYGNIEVVDWNNKENYLEDIKLLVNSTSLGMTGKNELEIDLSSLPKDALVNDIVYAPLNTQLLCKAKNNGNEIVTGIGMLIHQAIPAFEAWFGIKPKVTQELEKLVLS